jgi:hypothetical protein
MADAYVWRQTCAFRTGEKEAVAQAGRYSNCLNQLEKLLNRRRMREYQAHLWVHSQD